METSRLQTKGPVNLRYELLALFGIESQTPDLCSHPIRLQLVNWSPMLWIVGTATCHSENKNSMLLLPNHDRIQQFPAN